MAERTRSCSVNALLEQRANELAIINSIQQGMAAELDFQAIVDLVGDKLREVFGSGDLSIRWWDDEADTIDAAVRVEHGAAPADSARRAARAAGGPTSRLLRDGVGA